MPLIRVRMIPRQSRAIGGSQRASYCCVENVPFNVCKPITNNGYVLAFALLNFSHKM
jgi:hypothetical protein